MGQASSSETLSISGGDGYRYWVGLIMKPLHTGSKKTVYKGVLMGHGPRQWEKVVAKSFTKISGTKESWTYEVKKADITKQLAHKFVQAHHLGCKIKVIVPGIVQMDRVSNIDKWLSGKNKRRGLDKEEWISVEEFIPGHFFRFCPWQTEGTGEIMDSEHLQVFSHFTYNHSNGTFVVCDFQGVCAEKGSIKKYTLTDCSIHSSHKLFGLFDQGEYGIKEFFKFHKCTSVCKGWPIPTPLTPPPTFEEACVQQLTLSPPPAFENIIFPSNSTEMLNEERGASQEEVSLMRRRHASDHQRRRRRQGESSANRLSVDGCPQRRRSHGSIDVQITTTVRHNVPQSPSCDNLPGAVVSDEDQPPSYSSLCGQGSHTELGETAVKCPSVCVSPPLCRPEVAESTYNSQPPPYDSVVSVSTGPSRERHQSGGCGTRVTNVEHETLRRVRSASERRALFERASQGQVHPSASDPLFDHLQIGARDRSWSDNSRSMNPLRQRRLLSQHSGGSAFYLGEMEPDLPPLIVPSAPPMSHAFDNT